MNIQSFDLGTLPWGKHEQSENLFHRLEHHCADVAACFEELVQDHVLRERFLRAAGEDLCPTNWSRLTVLAFLHDYGKINAGFQFKVCEDRAKDAPSRAGHIKEALWACARPEVCEALGLYELQDWGNIEPYLRACLAHHGRPAQLPSLTQDQGPPCIWKPHKGYDPIDAAKMLARKARNWFPEAFGNAPCLPDSPALVHLFAGTLTLADQIGSARKFFDLVPTEDPGYINRARRQAKLAIEARLFCRKEWPSLALGDDPPPTNEHEFKNLFGHDSPRPLQSEIAKVSLDSPLVILESETGSGKTEAALLRFAALWRARQVDGLYFALPTRAAAKQIHRRVVDSLKNLFPEKPIDPVLAIPGYITVGDEIRGHPGERRFEVYWEDEPDEKARQARWAAESTRHFLSAPAAVGTVDQAMLGALRVKWAHLRCASLSRSLLVVDEVHASDAYMTEVLHTLLRGHLLLGGHAMLMSATLGSAARSRFVGKSPEPSHETCADVPYPLITWKEGTAISAKPVKDSGNQKEVSMELLPHMEHPREVAARALAVAQDGGKALVIRNTVTSCVAVFNDLIDLGGAQFALTVKGHPAPHHSRFAVEDRRLLDDAVEQALGKKGRSRGGAVVIGTQTLEQSLDIDADQLFSDLCPVDVLLQRIGRVHRHADTARPSCFTTPRCAVLIAEDGLERGLGGGLRKFGIGTHKEKQRSVYNNIVGLEATRRLVVDNPAWVIPKMNRMLVESATHPYALCELAKELGAKWQEAEQQSHGTEAAWRRHATQQVFDRESQFTEETVFTDNEESIRTRLGEDGPRIKLSEPAQGPFGTAVRTFNLPAHMFRHDFPSRDEIEAAHAKPNPEGCLVLEVGKARFTYDRAGVTLDSHWGIRG